MDHSKKDKKMNQDAADQTAPQTQDAAGNSEPKVTEPESAETADKTAEPAAEPAGPAKSDPKTAMKIAELEAKISELDDKYKRALANGANEARLAEMKIKNARTNAAEATVLKMVPLIDAIYLAINANPDSLGPVEKTLEKSMKDLGLERIDAKKGTEFDPTVHNALMVEAGEGDREVISEELQPGYKYAGDVIRPAMVKVTHVK